MSEKSENVVPKAQVSVHKPKDFQFNVRRGKETRKYSHLRSRNQRTFSFYSLTRRLIDWQITNESIDCCSSSSNKNSAVKVTKIILKKQTKKKKKWVLYQIWPLINSHRNESLLLPTVAAISQLAVQLVVSRTRGLLMLTPLAQELWTENGPLLAG